MTEQDIRITAVIPAYNAEQTIRRSLDSVAAQTEAVDEIIVVDDGSTDTTGRIIQSEYPQVRYIRQANAGPSTARNRGIQEASCEWIAFLDADDEWLPEKTSRQKEVLGQHPELVWIAGNYLRRSHDQRELPNQSRDTLLKQMESDCLFASYAHAYLAKSVGTMNFLVRREVLMEAGMFMEGWKSSEDHDIWFRVSYRHEPLGFVPEPISRYYMDRPDSLASRRPGWEFTQQFVNRHLEFSAQFHKLHEFEPCARRIVVDWIRGALFDNRIILIRSFVKPFTRMLSWRWRLFLGLALIWPDCTMKALRIVSLIIRKLNLRRRVIRTWDYGANGIKES